MKYDVLTLAEGRSVLEYMEKVSKKLCIEMCMKLQVLNC